VILLVQRLDPKAVLPRRATPGSVGYDLYAVESVTIAPFSFQKIRTGIACAIPPGCYGRIAPRSGFAVKQGVSVLAGVIDPDYRGEIMVCLANYAGGVGAVHVDPGDRIAQLIIERCEVPPVVEADSLDETERGDGGFGSTGR
jgi:dUTP pyrophosphatase